MSRDLPRVLSLGKALNTVPSRTDPHVEVESDRLDRVSLLDSTRRRSSQRSRSQVKLTRFPVLYLLHCFLGSSASLHWDQTEKRSSPSTGPFRPIAIGLDTSQSVPPKFTPRSHGIALPLRLQPPTCRPPSSSSGMPRPCTTARVRLSLDPILACVRARVTPC